MAHAFSPDGENYLIFYAILNSLSPEQQKDEKRIGYITIWEIYHQLKGINLKAENALVTAKNVVVELFKNSVAVRPVFKTEYFLLEMLENVFKLYK